MATIDQLGPADLRAIVAGFRDALRDHQEAINRLNVYPVPDGDTGTNMALTLESVEGRHVGDRTGPGNLARFHETTPWKVRVPMAAVCEVCGKHPGFGNSISHSHRRTKRRWNPNIQRVRALVNGAPKRLHVCTGCIKAGKVQKAVR